MKKTNVKIDKEMLARAMEKATSKHIALSATKIVNFMLHRVIEDDFKLVLDFTALEWNENHITTMYWEEGLMNEFRDFIWKKGGRTDYSFMFNLLVWNFLNVY